MGGVDRSDQCLSYYPVLPEINSEILPEDFSTFVKSNCVEFFVIFLKNGGILDHIGFRMKLIERLIEEGGSESGSRNFVGCKISEKCHSFNRKALPSYAESDSSKKKKEHRENVGVCNFK
ncbi:piggyBac transposable element-derived protein 4 [Trichonephila clavipes]|nr:piggyBac transposable element-derived protein 4 [Trichonephila clavipes]